MASWELEQGPARTWGAAILSECPRCGQLYVQTGDQGLSPNTCRGL